MTAAQATDALTEAVCQARLRARLDRRFSRHVIQETIAVLPERCDSNTAEYLTPVVKSAIHKKVLAGVIVIGFIATVFWEVIVGCIVALIVRWLMDDSEKRGLIQQARGN